MKFNIETTKKTVLGFLICGLSVAANAAPITPVNISQCLLQAMASTPYQILLPTSAKVNPIHTPLCSKGGTYVRIDGAADFQKTADFLKPYNLSPLELNVPQIGKFAFWQVWAAKHPDINVGEDGAMGSYNEAIISVAAKRNPAPLDVLSVLGQLFQAPTPETFGLFVAKIWVTSDIAVSAGNEIWGFNKSKATIDLEVQGGRIRANIREGANRVLDFNVAEPTKPSQATVNFYTYTRFTRAAAVLSSANDPAGALVDVFDPKTDQIHFFNTGYGSLMNSFGFQAAGSAIPNKTYIPSADLQFGDAEEIK
jgi:hypothetical protein